MADASAPASFSDFRINHLPPYLLGEIASSVLAFRESGKDIIDLSRVNPDQGPPPAAVDRLVQAALRSSNHRYSASQGIRRLRTAIVDRYAAHFGVTVSSDTETIVTLGTKEGLAHLLLAILSPGDPVILLTPSYPVHNAAVAIAGGSALSLPLYSSWDQAHAEQYQLSAASDDFFERLEQLVTHAWPRPKALVMSFPHNPTGSTVELSFFSRMVEFALRENIYLVHDFAYSGICFDGYSAPSLLAVPEARQVSIEFSSLSKGFSMPGWRVGFAAGNEQLIGALKRIKSFLDFGVFQPLQIAAIDVLTTQRSFEQEVSEMYRLRRDAFVPGLAALGWETVTPRGTLFVWARIPRDAKDRDGNNFARGLLEEQQVAVCPGVGFAPEAQDCVRFALVEPERRLRAALERIGSHGGFKTK